MDPEATLRDAKTYVSEIDAREDCANALSNYFQWRLRGGFEPPNGDERAFELLRQLGAVADTLSEALREC